MTTKQVTICGYKIDVNNYGDATYLYPSFNGNAEYRATHKEFRKLSHYLRTIKWALKTRDEIFGDKSDEQS
jgi:hypothetical protein